MTDQTPTLDSLCETIRELLPKVTPLLAPEDVDGGTMVIDDPDSQTLSAVQTGDASLRAFGMWKKDAEFFAWCLIHRRLIALAPTMATALLSLASERAKQEAGSRAKFPRDLLKQLIIAHFNEDSRKDLLFTRWKDGIDVEHTTYSVEALADDILAWQAASKPAALNVEKAAEEIDEEQSKLRGSEAYRASRIEATATLLRKHLTEAPALSEEERALLDEARHRSWCDPECQGRCDLCPDTFRQRVIAIIDRTYPLTSPEGSGAKEGE